MVAAPAVKLHLQVEWQRGNSGKLSCAAGACRPPAAAAALPLPGRSHRAGRLLSSSRRINELQISAGERWQACLGQVQAALFTWGGSKRASRVRRVASRAGRAAAWCSAAVKTARNAAGSHDAGRSTAPRQPLAGAPRGARAVHGICNCPKCIMESIQMLRTRWTASGGRWRRTLPRPQDTGPKLSLVVRNCLQAPGSIQ